MHKIRSLDEFYYPNLPDLTSRNAAQVATRYLTDGSQGNRKEDGDWWPILAVGQLWLWIIDDSECFFCNHHLVWANFALQ